MSLRVLALLGCLLACWAKPAAASSDDPHVLVLGRISDDPKSHYEQLKPLLDYIVPRIVNNGVERFMFGSSIDSVLGAPNQPLAAAYTLWPLLIIILFLLSIGIAYVRKLIVLFGPNWKIEVGVIAHDSHNAEAVE